MMRTTPQLGGSTPLPIHRRPLRPFSLPVVKGGVIMDRRGGGERSGVVSTLSDYVRLSVKGKCPLSQEAALAGVRGVPRT